MIKQGITNNSIIEKKFKILRTSIMLGNIDNRSEAMATYEEAAREVDNLRRGEYEELLASKTYTTTSLEDEQSRLMDLIQFIENRINERNEFIDDYIKITSNFLDDLPKVSLEDELPDYRLRLDNITEYLNNCKEIEELNDRLKKLRDELEEKYENKANNELINSKLEDELIDEFNKIIVNDEYYASLNYADLDVEIAKAEKSMKEKEDVMNTFVSSYEALKNAGISGTEREEYLSYVQDARNDFYNEINKLSLLKIYKLVLNKETSYDLLYEKREEIDNILKEREQYRHDLNITSRDILMQFINICNEQFSVIKAQKYNSENIDKLILEISDCEERLDDLEKANNREEILALVAEYDVKSPEPIKLEMPKEDEIREEVVVENTNEIDSRFGTRPVANNMVVRVKEPVKIDVKKATDTAKIVMKRVVIVLEPKKFNKRKEKLEALEKEILEEDRKEEIIEQNEEVVETPENKIVIESAGDNKITINLGADNEEDKEEIFEDEEVVTGPKEIFPTEPIMEEEKPDFVQEDKEIFKDFERDKPLDLFSQTDPFLDDNQFEIDASLDKQDENSKGMPVVSNIGTVKPNNVLDKLNDVSKDNEDIILPTMGLTNNEKVDVPIVSENYIS